MDQASLKFRPQAKFTSKVNITVDTVGAVNVSQGVSNRK